MNEIMKQILINAGYSNTDVIDFSRSICEQSVRQEIAEGLSGDLKLIKANLDGLVQHISNFGNELNFGNDEGENNENKQ